MEAGDAELLLLRLGLIGIVFAFVLVASLTMRTALQPARRRDSRPAASARLMVQVAAGTGLAPGTAFPLVGATIVGRSPDAGIILGDPSVSNEHAILERAASGWRLTDLRSTNGTVVNGTALEGRAMSLRSGDIITVGAVVLRFQG